MVVQYSTRTMGTRGGLNESQQPQLTANCGPRLSRAAGSQGQNMVTQTVATLDSAAQTTLEQREALGRQFAMIVERAVYQLRSLLEEALSRQPAPSGE